MARIGIDIDSTLHHYWDLLEPIVLERFGVAAAYDEQHDWGLPGLDGDQLIAVIDETHSDANIASAEPYPGSVEAVGRWHEAGHWIHITSHRRDRCAPATARWLETRGYAYDDLHCSFDKITRCVELGIDVLVDDSPVNIGAARDRGMIAATLIHPWNAEIAVEGDVLAADRWPELERLVDDAIEAT